MGKLFKNLKPYWKSVLVIVVLLVVQAFCDLSLPQYTSDIIDTGIQNSGVEHILPEKITAEEFQNAQLFMTADEQKTWQDAYNGDGDILDRNDCSKKDLEQFDSDLIVPILLNYQMSTRGAIEAIQMAKLRGAPVTCEVTPHHLWFTNDTCDYRVNPPIRTADDVQALIDAIRSGVVDAIATDHAPHSEEDKLKGMAGMVGSETAFGVCYTKLCKEEGLPLELLSHLMSTRPAEILGLAKGQLEPGYDADFVLVDLDTPYTVDKNKLHSKSHNCPFDGAQLYGRVCATVKGGELTYQAEE